MDDSTHKKENLANGPSIDSEQRVLYMTTGNNPSRNVHHHRETSPTCQTGNAEAILTIARARGKHILSDPEIQDIIDFAPPPNNSVRQLLPVSRNRGRSPQEGIIEEKLCDNNGSMPTLLRKSSSLTHVQEHPELPTPEPYKGVHSSDEATLIQSSYNEEDAGSRSPVCLHKSVNRENDNHEQDQVPLNINGDRHGQQNSGTLAVNTQQRGGTIHTAEGNYLCPERPASRPSSTSVESIHSTTPRHRVTDARVRKTLVTASTPRSQQSSPTLTPSRVPTEEDLLLLLMRRRRIRDHAHARLLNDLHQLQAEYQTLKKEELDRDAELLDVKTKLQDAIRQSHIREADIRAFADKYDKLKVWARDMHDAFASTRAEGSRLNEEVSKLKTEKDAQSRERSELLEKIEGISEPMRKFKEAIAELRATSIELQTTQDLLGQARKEVQDEIVKNKAHTLRIERLESGQQSMNFRFLKQQDEMQNGLSLVSSLLQKNDNGFLHEIVVELTDVMHGLRQDVVTREQSSAQFSSLLHANEQNHTKLSTAIASVAHAQAEYQTVQELREEIDQLKVRHAAEFAECSERIRLEGATNLANARCEVEEEKARSRKLQLKNTEAEQILSNHTVKLSEMDEQLSAKTKHIEQLREEKGELEEQLRGIGGASQDLANKVRRLEEKEKQQESENTRLTKISTAHKAKIANLEQNVKDHNVSIQEKAAKIAQLEKTCEEHRKAETHSQKDLKDVCGDVLALKATIKTKDSQLETLGKDLKSARASVDKISHFEGTVHEQRTKIQEMSKDLKDCRDELEIKQVNLSEKQQRIEELQEEELRITEEFKKLAAAHGHCGLKDEEINSLIKTNNGLSEEMRPLSILVKLLTNEEKMALDERTVFAIKAMIQRLHGQGRNTSEGDNEVFVRPRRAANRDGHGDDTDMVVPDSQGQAPQYDTGTRNLSNDNGELDEFLKDDFNPTTCIRTSPDMTLASRLAPMLNNTTMSEEIRPPTSNDEMLLRSSDTGSYPRSTQTQATVLVPASTHEVSPMRTRQGSQIRHGTPRPQTSADGDSVINFSTPPAHPREAYPPNSAAKRRQTSEAPESAAKRRAVNLKNLEVHPSRNSAVSSQAQNSDSEDSSELPVGGRKGSSATASKMSAPNKTKKKAATGSSRKNSKSARMEAQFNAPAM